MPDPIPQAGLNPNALAVADAALLLSRSAGEEITVEMLELAIADGAPTNADGTIHLVHFAAWFVKEMGRGE
jgi:hypothetical protein